MAVRAKTIAVSTTPAVALDASKSDDGISGSITNAGATIVYVGGDDMTSGNAATNGIALAPSAGMDDVELAYGEQLFVVTTSGSGSVTALSSKGP